MGNQPKDVKKIPIDIPLSGKLVTSVDPAQLQPGEFSSVKNMRYTDRGITGVKGMTKINTNAIATYTHGKEGFHFRKAQPAESHVMVQSFNAAENAARIMENTTAIPSAGDFSATALYSPAASVGRFSDWPDSSMAFCDGTNSLIWGGNEMRVAQFINYDPAGTFKKDYTTVINNTLTDAQNIATLTRYTSSDTFNSANYLDNSCVTLTGWTSNTDGTGAAVTVDNTTYPAITTIKSDSGSGTGATQYAGFSNNSVTTPVPAVLVLTVKCMFAAIGTKANEDFFQAQVWNGSTGFKAKFCTDGLFVTYGGTDYEVGTNIVDTTGAAWQKYDFVLTFSTHKCTVYLNNVSQGEVDFDVFTGIVMTHFTQWGVTSANRITYTDYVQLGTTFYPASTNFTRVKVGSTRPISGAKFYMGSTVNASASTASVQYWDGSNNTVCSNIADGTVTSGKTLTKTGTISFDSTVATAKPYVYQNTVAYWYDFIFATIDNSVTVYYVTLVAPMQPVVDIWDGSLRTILQFKLEVSPTDIHDYVNKVNKDTYVEGDATTYVSLSSMTSSEYLYASFSERQAGLLFHFPGALINSTVCLMQVDYWNGTTWVDVSGLQDGTSLGGAPFYKNGIASWYPPNESAEFVTNVASDIALYTYRIHFTATLSSGAAVYYIAGIPAQKSVHGYKFPTTWQDRAILCSDQSGLKNSVLISAQGTSCVFNGTDSTSLEFGDDTDIIAATALFTRYTSNFYESLVVVKQEGIWVVDGTNPGDYRTYEIQSSYGCAAPRTLQVCDLGYEISPGINKLIMIWLSSDGIVAFDGNTVFRIDRDISNYFDKSKTECVNATYIADSFAWYDPMFHAYHIRFASGSQTTPDTEFAFDVVRQKWGEVSRTSQTTRGAFTVTDTSDNKYVYSVDNSGFMYRHEYGNSWNGTAIAYEFKTGDIFTPDSLTQESLRKFDLWVQQKTGGGNVTVTYYGDGDNTGVVLGTMSVVNANSRYAKKVFSNGANVNASSCHAIKVAYSNATSETAGFTPVRMGWLIEPKREVY